MPTINRGACAPSGKSRWSHNGVRQHHRIHIPERSPPERPLRLTGGLVKSFNFVDGNHLGDSRTLLRILRATSLTRCLAYTPWARTLTPLPINVSRMFSPSSLMATRFFSSTTSSRPLRSARAVSHAVFNSVAQGATSIPSNTNLRCFELSKTEIFNMAVAPYTLDIRQEPCQTCRAVSLWIFRRK